MKRRRHTPKQIVRKLREADKLLAEGIAVPEVAKALQVPEQTYRGTSLRSPLGLTPRGTAAPPTAVQPNPDHRLSQQVDR